MSQLGANLACCDANSQLYCLLVCACGCFCAQDVDVGQVVSWRGWASGKQVLGATPLQRLSRWVGGGNFRQHLGRPPKIPLPTFRWCFGGQSICKPRRIRATQAKETPPPHCVHEITTAEIYHQPRTAPCHLGSILITHNGRRSHQVPPSGPQVVGAKRTPARPRDVPHRARTHPNHIRKGQRGAKASREADYPGQVRQ